MTRSTDDGRTGEKLGRLRSFFIWLAGHDPAGLARDGREATAPISMVGAVVAVAIIGTGTAWAVAGYHWVGSAQAAVAGFGIGAAIVLALDRSAIYAMDTAAAHGWRLLMFVSIRLVMVLLVSSVTVEALGPLALGAELRSHALKMREQSDADRRSRLGEQFAIGEKTNAAQSADGAVKAAKQALQIVPREVRDLQGTAAACWRDYGRRRNGSRAEASPAIRADLLRRAGTCRAADAKARRSLSDHRDRARAVLAESETRQRVAQATVEGATNELDDRVKAAAAIEAGAITENSATVRENLLASDWGAWLRWRIVQAAWVVFELAPLISKAFSGRSVPGHRIAADRAVLVGRYERREQAANDGARREAAMRTEMDQAAMEAFASPELRQEITAHFKLRLTAVVPLEVAKQIITEIEIAADDVDAAKRRNPDHAAIIATAWDRAVTDVVDRLNRSDQSPGNQHWREAA